MMVNGDDDEGDESDEMSVAVTKLEDKQMLTLSVSRTAK